MRFEIGLAIIDRNLVGDQRILRVHAQNRAVRNHAIVTLVRGTRRYDDHLALGLGQSALFQEQRVVVREKCAELVGPVRERQKHIGHETGLLLDFLDALAHVRRQLGQLRHRVTADRRRAHVSGLRISPRAWRETPSCLPCGPPYRTQTRTAWSRERSRWRDPCRVRAARPAWRPARPPALSPPPGAPLRALFPSTARRRPRRSRARCAAPPRP